MNRSLAGSGDWQTTVTLGEMRELIKKEDYEQQSI